MSPIPHHQSVTTNGKKSSGTNLRTYKPREEGDAWCGDGREIALLKYLFSPTRCPSLRGSPTKVLAAIDRFACEECWLMNVGSEKGSLVCAEITRRKPQTMVELGGYVGYSAVFFADALRKAGGAVYYSLEFNPLYAACIMAVVGLAGLEDVVKVLVGPAEEGIRRLESGDHKLEKGRIDMLFLDHYKPAYVTDLKLCEELGLIGPGSVVVADNVVDPGNPPYLEYVSASAEEKTRDVKQGKWRDEEELIRYFPERYLYLEERKFLNMDVVGNPRLAYETQIHQDLTLIGDMDGISVSHCIGIRK